MEKIKKRNNKLAELQKELQEDEINVKKYEARTPVRVHPEDALYDAPV